MLPPKKSREPPKSFSNSPPNSPASSTPRKKRKTQPPNSPALSLSTPKKKNVKNSKSPGGQQSRNPTKTETQVVRYEPQDVNKAYSSIHVVKKEYEEVEVGQLMSSLELLIHVLGKQDPHWNPDSARYFFNFCAYAKQAPHVLLDRTLNGFVFVMHKNATVNFRLDFNGFSEAEALVEGMVERIQSVMKNREQVDSVFLVGEEKQSLDKAQQRFDNKKLLLRLKLVILCYHMSKHLHTNSEKPRLHNSDLCIFSFYMMDQCSTEHEYWSAMRSLAVIFYKDESISQDHADILNDAWASNPRQGDKEPAELLLRRVMDLASPILKEKGYVSEARIYVECANIVYETNSHRNNLILTVPSLNSRKFTPGPNSHPPKRCWFPSLVVAMYDLLLEAHPQKFSQLKKAIVSAASSFSPPGSKKKKAAKPPPKKPVKKQTPPPTEGTRKSPRRRRQVTL